MLIKQGHGCAKPHGEGVEEIRMIRQFMHALREMHRINDKESLFLFLFLFVK
jgi:hypothetical protein